MRVKGLILAAGYGTRFLPITRVLPKEMLPLVDRPSLDFVVQEMVEAGIEDILVVTSRRKRAIEDWFDRDPELEGVFVSEGATGKLAKVAPPAVRVSFMRQQEMRGTGHALLLAREFAGDDALVVAFPDDLFGPPSASAQLVATWQRTGRSVLSAADLSGEDVSRYGVLDVVPSEGGLLLRNIVEKPAPGTEPSHLVSLGRFLYTPELFAHLERGWAAHTGGEFFPMGAINALAAEGLVAVEVLDGVRMDTGTPLGLLMASVEEGLSRPDLGPALRQWLTERLDQP
ncbi:MAG: UTP--glucose-1-phosphate uridylyltransferase [Deltaproteobacteria bacterium]|nr:UTP--glucose-1-phosphate uridylyltransferase [Deltaproteobacteria bacterium]